MKKRNVMIGITLGMLFLSSVIAQERIIREKLGAYLPELKVDRIEKTPIEGVYQVTAGPSIAYASSDGEYLFQGELLALADTANLTKQAKYQARLDFLAQVPVEQYIPFLAPEEKHRITVFTDVDCGFCRKFHQEVPELNRRGISVQYLAFPRSAAGSASFNKSVSVWCAANKKKAISIAKRGEKINKTQCPNPVQSHVELGIALGVSGTPSIFLEDGRLISGYVSPDRLESFLN